MNKLTKLLCACMLAASLGACTSKNETKSSDKSLQDQMNIVSETIGDNYAANMELNKQEALSRFNLQESDVEDVKAQMPMISAHVDTMVIVRAKEGKVEAVKTALETYRQSMIDDTLQYPSNIPVIQGSIVKVNNNDVYFIMLSNFDEGFMEKDEATQITEIQAQNEAVYNKLI